MSSLEKFLLFVAAPTVLALSLIEAGVLARRQRYDWRALGVSVFDLVVRIAVSIVLPLSVAARSLRTFFGYLFMPPGWSPHGMGSTTAELRARAHDAGATTLTISHG